MRWDLDRAGLLRPTQETSGRPEFRAGVEERLSTSTWVDVTEDDHPRYRASLAPYQRRLSVRAERKRRRRQE